jgi:cytochrome c biogenesis protein
MSAREKVPGKVPAKVTELGGLGLLRWMWRQLTSMSTALLLLLLLAIAAIPGSLVPQSGVDALRTSNWQEDNPTLAPIFAKLGLFSVYESVWFAAIYLLLLISLIGCFVPRSLVYWRALRSLPPMVPERLERLPRFAHVDQPQLSLDQIEGELRRRRYRIRRTEQAISAEKGYLREFGNLLFHVSVLVVLVGYAAGSMGGYKGGVIVMEDDSFTNTLTQYDDFVPGSLFQEEWLDPFIFTINSFDLNWVFSGPAKGTARNFVSSLTYTESPGGHPQQYDLRVNHPLRIGGTDIFLIGHGYAPVFTVRDPNGKMVWTSPTVFLPTNPATFESYGVLKVPNADLAFEGALYPTYAFTKETGPYSIFGDAMNPAVSMIAYTGDLGMNSGPSQSVYELQRAGLTRLKKPDGSELRVDLALGETVDLPDGAGSISFDRLERWNRIQVSRTPFAWLALTGVVLALGGLMLSLFIHPRRLWVRQKGQALQVGGLDRSGRSDLADFAELVKVIGDRRD